MRDLWETIQETSAGKAASRRESAIKIDVDVDGDARKINSGKNRKVKYCFVDQSRYIYPGRVSSLEGDFFLAN